MYTHNTRKNPLRVKTFKKRTHNESIEFSSECLTGIDTSCQAIQPNSAGVACSIKNSRLAQETSWH